MNNTILKTTSEIRSERIPVRNINIEQKEKLTKLEKFAVWITSHVGTMGFFLIIVFWTIGWLSWNIVAPHNLRFDPYPGFVLWLFISNMIQIFLMPLIMIGQNLQGRHAEARAENDYEVNVKAEREIGYILEHLEKQSELITEIVKKIDQKNN